MQQLSDLEHIRMRPGMYVGCTTGRGLHHLFLELLDNVVDQYLAGKATTVRAAFDGDVLEVIDDGDGLPFDVTHDSGVPLATRYLTKIRRHAPTADGHTPHVHLGGWGVGLRIVTALTHTCEVNSWRTGQLWRQSFTRGIADGPAKIIRRGEERGTVIRITVDKGIFKDQSWSSDTIDDRLRQAAYLMAGLRVQTPQWAMKADRGLAQLAEQLSGQQDGYTADNRPTFRMHGHFGDLHVQVAAISTTSNEKTQWHSFANGNISYEGGTHLTALKRAVAACRWRPSIAMIHVIMQTPRFAGPTKTKLDVDEIFSPIYQSIKPPMKQFCTEQGIS
ncbi:MAG: hypothetical protein HKN47_27910 [Pirellulaceae bacterium]|nr:hypothetical protein [Pirellulaceae bacterium]